MNPATVSAAASTGVDQLLSAHSVALVGATERSFWSRRIVVNLTQYGFSGQVYIVNPRYPEQFGRPSHTSVAAIGEPVDLVFALTAAARIDDVVADCIAAGVRGLIVIGGGFAETGSAGRERQRRLVDACRDAGIALLGPNCLGMVDFHTGLAPFADRIYAPMPAGSTAVVSQSGALLQLIYRAAQRRQLGLSHLVSVGNAGMFTPDQIMSSLVERPEVKVLAAYLEGIGDAAGFTRMALRATDLNKPVVVLKTGRSRAASAAALAHTGALTGDEELTDAAFRRLGVIRVDSPEELLDCAAMCSGASRPSGARIAVLSSSGGSCGIASDLIDATDLELAELPDAIRRRLAEALPDFASPRNPLDTTGIIVDQPDILRRCVELLGSSGAYDSVLVNLDLPAAADPEPDDLAGRLDGIADAVSASPVFTALASTFANDTGAARLKVLHERGIVICDGLASALRALDRVARTEAARSRPRTFPGTTGLKHQPVSLRGRAALGEYESVQVLADRGLPTGGQFLARTEEEAVAAAEKLGYPVVVKLQADGVLHKSDIGGVMLNVRDAEAVRTSWQHMRGLVDADRFDGVLVTEHVAAPVAELIAGVVIDPQWGPAVMVGFGGVHAELLKDTALELAPLDQESARAMLDRLRGRRLLDGYRGQPTADIDALVQFLVDLSQIATSLGDEVAAIDINPVFALQSGCRVGDALVVGSSTIATTRY